MNRIKVLFISLALSVATVFGAVGASQQQQSPPARKSEAQAGAVRFVALGDMGTGEKGQFDIARQMVSYYDDKHYHMVLLLGDNVYPNGNPSELPAKFEKPYAELLKWGVPFHAVLGNHDLDYGGGIAQTNYKPFNMGGHSYYSFVEGNGLVEFFALDSNRMDKTQLAWLDGALSASKARWKIAFYHHPIYSSGEKHGSNNRLRALLEPLFVRYGVAATFSGHDHVYERIKPQQGIQHFVSGAGGQLRRGNLNRQSQLTAAGNDQVNSFMYVEVTQNTLSFWAIDAEGRILDKGVLTPSRR
jgi:predicted MPP superfamily phosphohydrolase